MRKKSLILRWRLLLGVSALLAWTPVDLRAQPSAQATRVTNYTMLVIEGQVLFSRSGTQPRQQFDPAQPGMPLFVGDRVIVGPRSRLTIQRRDQSTFRFDEKTEFEVLRSKIAVTTGPTVRLLSGVLYFFHRGRPGRFDVETRTASAAVRGTEFHLSIDDAGTTVLTMIDGEVDLSNEVNTVRVPGGMEGVAVPGRAPFLRAALDTTNVIQWTLYYPGILDLNELPLAGDEQNALNGSLNAYRAGDLLRAINDYPAGRQPASDAERIYLAGLLLAVGQVDDAQPLLAQVPSAAGPTTNARLAQALQQLIATVKTRAQAPAAAPELAGEWLVESYRLQASANLPGALQAARNAVARSPEFGFGWARVAELEFSFGRIDAAVEAVGKALQFSPRNAQAIALKGFLAAARNQMTPAIALFDEAISVDPRLANAWLGRGLSQIRTGKLEAGREDLLTAASLEPQRSFLRSYLGKAWTDSGETKLAEQELELAKQFDPRDPTAWLYSALLKHQNNRINEAIRELEHAQDLNTNRAIFRSGFLLDQDRAVRSANLARIYRDAGMTDWSMREAGRAVTADYANYSAHLFLANSYDELRDPNRINLRYETPAEAEYLIANLLAPVGAGMLSQSISHNEYSRLFERNRLGISSMTEYLSRGAWTEQVAQFGTFDGSTYLLEAFYRNDPGQRPNNDFEETELRLQAKQQVTAKDSIYLSAEYYQAEGGDLLQYYDPAAANSGLRTKERQEPTASIGYHREWNPGLHTLFLASRLHDSISVLNPAQVTFFISRNEQGIDGIAPLQFRQRYEGELEVYSVELQQIWQETRHAAIFGGRFQAGQLGTDNLQQDPTVDFAELFPVDGIAANQSISSDFERLSFYGYYQFQIVDSLRLIGGLTYDRLTIPLNFQAAPLAEGERELDQTSPKAGLIWTPSAFTTVRGAYTRSLAGAGIDQSSQIEPTQVAGLNQSFRSIRPESVGGSQSGTRFEAYSFSIEQRLPTRTYLMVGGQILESDREGSFGVFEFGTQVATVTQTERKVDYRERSLSFGVNQLIGDYVSIGARYQVTEANLSDTFPEVLDSAEVLGGFRATQELQAVLHEVRLHAHYNHRCGFFIHGEALWFQGGNERYEPELRNEDFWQLNAFIGYRFPRRQAEVTLGLLNIADRDYRLNPLAYYNELPRERTLLARLRLHF